MQTNFPLSRLLAMTSVLFNTKSGKYITWEIRSEDDEVPHWEFCEEGVYLFTLSSTDEVVHTEGKEFILKEDENEAWFVRPFYEVDVTNFILAYGTNSYTEAEYKTLASDMLAQVQGVIDEASIF